MCRIAGCRNPRDTTAGVIISFWRQPFIGSCASRTQHRAGVAQFLHKSLAQEGLEDTRTSLFTSAAHTSSSRASSRRAPRTADRAARPLAPHIAEEPGPRSDTESVWHGLLSGLRRRTVRNSSEYPGVGQRQAPLPEGVCRLMTPAEIQADVVTAPEAQKWPGRQTPKKINVVPGKIINIRSDTPSRLNTDL